LKGKNGENGKRMKAGRDGEMRVSEGNRETI